MCPILSRYPAGTPLIRRRRRRLTLVVVRVSACWKKEQEEDSSISNDPISFRTKGGASFDRQQTQIAQVALNEASRESRRQSEGDQFSGFVRGLTFSLAPLSSSSFKFFLRFFLSLSPALEKQIRNGKSLPSYCEEEMQPLYLLYEEEPFQMRAA